MIIKIKISDLKPNNRKAGRTKAQLTYVENMVKSGHIPYILINSNNEIIDGNHRVQYCKKYNIAEIYAEVIS